MFWVKETIQLNKTLRITKLYSLSPISGNYLLHTLTSFRKYSLRIDLEDFEGNTAFAMYKQFRVGSEEDGFRLTAEGYSGTAGLCV